MSSKTREAKIESKARELVLARGGLWEKLPPTSGVSHRPDRLLLFPGAPPIFIELKRPGEVPTPEQYAALTGLRGRGFAARWFDSWVPLQEFIEAEVISSQRQRRKR
jgi:hypothetical protein